MKFLLGVKTALLGLSATSLVAADILAGIPTLPFEVSNGSFALSSIQTIVVDSQYASAVDDSMDTLIPPTLFAFATTFAEDLSSIFNISATVTNGTAAAGGVFLTLGDSSRYLNASGDPSSEGYTLTVTPTQITITGASPLGAWWGTRTVLQQATLNDGAVPSGTGDDVPGWATRGMMLDAGRHFYPKEFMQEMCAYMSFFKQNTFHLHLSDNLYNNVDIYSQERSLSLYARFRLWSDAEALVGLNKYKNESYTREDFDEIQSSCAARGVTVIPEIEAPGHALVIVQWKPELGYSTDLSLLNISHPETIPTMETIWSEFLPWFHTKVVSIGADEYTGPSTDYVTFVNAMASYIGTTVGKAIRIWGTFPPIYNGTYENVYQNVSVQHWEYFEDNPYYDYILNNYSVVNSNDDFYVVNKWAPPGGYLNHINLTKTFDGTPPNATYWRPYVFDQSNATDNPPESSPYVLGSIVPLWNDYGANASVYSEAYYAWRPGVPALADKQWGGNLSTADFDAIFETLHAVVPGQNLDRTIPSVSDVIFNYTLSSNGTLKDISPNSFSVETDCAVPTGEDALELTPSCSIVTPHSSKGRNYTLTLAGLTVTNLTTPTNATLLTGGDSTLMLTPNITFFAGGNYFRLNETVPLGETVDLAIIARGNRTFASVSEGGVLLVDEAEFLAEMGINGEYFHWAEIAFEAPLKTVGGAGSGWIGSLKGFSLTSVA
ncbi:family 20 glycoside hydrolase [Cryphonectria parasitica EP155]|uniref:beta-N-acetylhexosaminidase n=1 Tax=Cryphonectria parasitica (strain ATCC 38755 / EP155) TaxID=660469 RepID=A0A9P4XYV9_CRYP1|nr:family 20 glycoside hydrolase [Cryphonectria parasitica EP155]KAF3763433.1 family 20 glycoside hydrolase [Cryphonectria parasitica EP155]